MKKAVDDETDRLQIHGRSLTAAAGEIKLPRSSISKPTSWRKCIWPFRPATRFTLLLGSLLGILNLPCYSKPTIGRHSNLYSKEKQVLLRTFIHTFQVNDTIPKAQRKISGIVLNEKKERLAAVTVNLKNTERYVSTDENGRFVVAADSGAVILVSYTGYLSREISVADGAEISIVLTPSDQSLDEVVVVGYGQQRRNDLTGSIASVNSKSFEKQPLFRAEDALKGRAAGVHVHTPGGAPGGAVKIRIRGANSINGNNDPLYVIDGFVGGDIRTVSPADIASMDILKDASATAVYGSRGANGVVIITTKKGVAGRNQVAFDAFYSTSKASKTMKLLNGGQYMEIVNQRNSDLGLNPQFQQSEIDSVKSDGGTDWQKAILHNSPTQNYQLSFSGGSDKTKFYLSGNIADQEGIITNTFYKRYGLRANINSSFSKRLDLHFNIYGSYEQSSNNYTYNGRGNALGAALIFSPNVRIYDPVTNDYSKSPPYGPIASNPVYAAEGFDYDANILSLLSNIQLAYRITDELLLSIGGGVNANIYSNPYFKRNPPGASNSSSEAGYENGNTWVLQNTNMLTYQKTLARVHKLTIAAIMEQQATTSTASSSWATGFPTISLGYNNLSLGATSRVGSRYAQASLLSYLTRVNYSLMDRYLFTITMRADGSSKFQGDNKWGYFPSAAFAWRLSKASFIANSKVFQDLKLRMSYGLTGSQAINPYQTQNFLVQGRNYTYNGSDISIGIGPGSAGNPDLKWESTAQLDLGLDFAVLRGRLSGTIDLYRKKTNDLLMPKAIPLYNGGGATTSNIGSLQNRGFEFMLNGAIIDNRRLEINSSLNFSINRSKVLNLGAVTEIPTNGGFESPSLAPPFMVRVGEPLGQFWGLTFLGLWKSHESAEAAAYGNVPGDSRYADLNGDNKIDGNDMSNIGNAQPKFTWGWNTDIDFMQFELNLFFTGVSGNKVWNYTRWLPIGMGADVKNPTSIDILDRWTPANQNTTVPAFTKTNVTYAQSTQFMESGSFIRLSNVTLSYNLLPSIVNRLHIMHAKVFLSAQNPIVITSYKGFDPELSSTPTWSDVALGIDNGSYPALKIFTAGIKLSF